VNWHKAWSSCESSKPKNALSFSIHSPLKEDEHGGRMEEIRIQWTERAEPPKGTREKKNEVAGEDEML
jgi:hypothetical protein